MKITKREKEKFNKHNKSLNPDVPRPVINITLYKEYMVLGGAWADIAKNSYVSLPLDFK